MASPAVPGHFLGLQKTHIFLTFLNLIITAHVPNCIIFVLLYVQSLMWLFMDFLSWSLYIWTVFWIYIMAWYCPHYLCQFCMVFLCFHLPASLNVLLLMTNFYLNGPNQYLLFLSHLPGFPALPQLLAHALHGLSYSSTPSWNGPSSCIWCMSSHMLDTVMVHGSHCSTCMGIIDLSYLLSVSFGYLLIFGPSLSYWIGMIL